MDTKEVCMGKHNKRIFTATEGPNIHLVKKLGSQFWGALKFHLIIVCIFIPAKLFAEPAAAPATTATAAATPLTMEVTLQKLTADDGFVLKAIGAGKDIYLPIKNSWDVKTIHLHLNILHNNTAKHIDSIAALIKDFPISSINFENAKDQMTSWDIDIPTKYIKGPIITLQLRRNWQDNGVSCEDNQNVVDWISVQGDSTINYVYTQKPYQPNLNIFPIPFINNLSLAKDKISLFIPDDIDINELESTYYIANSLYKRRTWRGVDIKGFTFDSITEDMKKTSNIVIIGTASKIKPLLNQTNLPIKLNENGYLVDNNNQLIKDGTGLVMEIPSPWNPYYAVLIVTGNTSQAVRKAASALRDPNFEKWVLFNKYAFIDNSKTDIQQPIDWSDTSFIDLGYKDFVVYGGGTNSIKYELNLPTNKIPESIDISLHYSVSPLLSGINNSFISLKVNDFPVSGEKINIDNPDRVWDVHINNRNLLPGKNILTFSFNLKFHNRDCTPDDLSLAWGTIYSDSKLTVKFSKNDISYSFADLDDIEQNISLFIPSAGTIFTKNETIQLIINMATNIVNTKEFNIYYDTENIEKVSKNSNVVYVGSMSSNPLLNSLRHHFPFCYVNKQVIIKPTIIPYLHMSEEPPVGLLELIKSPYDPKQLFLLITADDVNGYDLVIDAFFNPIKNQYLRGNTALVYSDGTFTSINTNQLEQKSLNAQKMKKISGLVWKVVAAVAAIVFGGLIAIILIRRAKKYFSKNTTTKD
jgi:hypothetical protein